MGCAMPRPVHWQDLQNTPAEQILSRPGVSSANKSNAYEVRFLNQGYLVDVENGLVVSLSNAPGSLTQAFQILLIKYLILQGG